MTEARACIVAMFAALALFVAIIVGTCCIHDLGVMKRKLESMGASLAEMQRAHFSHNGRKHHSRALAIT